MDRVLADFRELVMPAVTHWNHPRFLAYFAVSGSEPGILGEMLTAALPFDARTPQQMIAAHLAKPPAPLRTKRPDIPQAVEAVVMRCLAKEPDERWQAADELLEALEALPTGSALRPALPDSPTLELPASPAEAPGGGPAGIGPRTGWGAGRWLALVAAAALIGLALAARFGWIGN